MNRKDLILAKISDLASDFLYYDRVEDEELPPGSIENAIREGELTYMDIFRKFESELIDKLEA